MANAAGRLRERGGAPHQADNPVTLLLNADVSERRIYEVSEALNRRRSDDKHHPVSVAKVGPKMYKLKRADHVVRLGSRASQYGNSVLIKRWLSANVSDNRERVEILIQLGREVKSDGAAGHCKKLRITSNVRFKVATSDAAKNVNSIGYFVDSLLMDLWPINGQYPRQNIHPVKPPGSVEIKNIGHGGGFTLGGGPAGATVGVHKTPNREYLETRGSHEIRATISEANIRTGGAWEWKLLEWKNHEPYDCCKDKISFTDMWKGPFEPAVIFDEIRNLWCEWDINDDAPSLRFHLKVRVGVANAPKVRNRIKNLRKSRCISRETFEENIILIIDPTASDMSEL